MYNLVVRRHRFTSLLGLFRLMKASSLLQLANQHRLANVVQSNVVLILVIINISKLRTILFFECGLGTFVPIYCIDSVRPIIISCHHYLSDELSLEFGTHRPLISSR
ncbi:hypothetical protein RF11_02971 [Thelohanellus kitauei]|uniref:Uncharacterized protein n=1 Tax=Thelohanellus kitauei TaxID=669202 RepID=A0A0C2JPZ5_THEKT|nr:hypothetical protein RF11_02971 [Thelohanellus kitauei]